MYQMMFHGSNLVPEGLEFGEPIMQASFSSYDFEPCYVIAYSGSDIGDTSFTQFGQTVNGIYSSIAFVLCNIGGFKECMSILNHTDDGQYVVATFTVPILAFKSMYVPDIPTYEKIETNIIEQPIEYTVATRPTNLNGYTPKNKKLLTYPYTYIGFNPSNGSSKTYRFEDFSSPTVKFKAMSEVNPNPQVALIPENHKGVYEDLQDVAFLGGYPTVSNKVNNFNVWLAQNSNMLRINREKATISYAKNKADTQFGMLNSAVSAGQSVSQGKLVEGTTSGIGLFQGDLDLTVNEKNYELALREQMAQVDAQSLLADNVSLSGSNATLLGYQKLSQHIFATYTIKAQFARRIDKYFDMFGYQTNELKVPNIHNRPNWNYVKTLNCNINGNIPQMDLAEIKELFNSGITLWHNTQNFKNYSVNNR